MSKIRPELFSPISTKQPTSNTNTAFVCLGLSAHTAPATAMTAPANRMVLGGPNTILFAGAVMAVAGAVWAESPRQTKAVLVLLVGCLVLIGLNNSGRIFDIVYAKGMFRDPGHVEFAKWNAISRVEVDREGGARAIVIDADANTYIMNADLNQWHGTVWEKNLMSAPPP